MAKDLLDMLVDSFWEGVAGEITSDGIMDSKFQEKEYGVEWIDIKKTEWIDVNCKKNKKLYDVNGNIIVIGKPSPKIHTMATYDMDGNLIEDSPVKVKKVTKKVIFMDVEDKKDEKGKLKKLYEEGYISKSRYNQLMRDLKNQ